MANDFSTIGLEIRDGAAYEALDARALREADGDRTVRTPDGSYAPWVVGDGVELWCYLDPEQRSNGFVPYFVGQARRRILLESRVTRAPLDGAFTGWFYDGGETIAPFVVDVPDYRAFDDLTLPFETTIALVGFARALDVHDDEAAFHSTGSGMAVRSFIPSGMFAAAAAETGSTDLPTSVGLLTGIVEAARQRYNVLTGRPYWWMRVDSLGGPIEIVADPSIPSAPPRAGCVVSAQCWLTGRPDREPLTV